ncbi:MAG: PAS domain-containing protein, partial [Frankiales bacterium]|nr:PAS domain-containing protein [Frankiales bacterium]
MAELTFRARRPVGWSRSPDVLAVRVVAAARLAALLAIVTVGSFRAPQHGRVATLLVLLGLVGVPWATAVLFNAERGDNRLAIYGGPALDLLALFAVHTATGSTGAVLPGYLAVIAFAVYTGGRRFAGIVIASAVTLTLLAHAARPHAVTLPSSSIIPFSCGILAVLFLVDRTTVLQARAAATSDRFRSRADTIVTHVADAVFVTDTSGRVVLANPGTERLVGRRAPEL